MTGLLIVGAGPFGLSMAAQAQHLGIDHIVVGQPMQFWKAHMPRGMYLRSAGDWHLDPEGDDTIEAFLRAQHLRPADVEPLSRDRYIEYVSWFQARKRITPLPLTLERLDGVKEVRRRFRATCSDGVVVEAESVVLALGFASSKHIPDDLARVFPPGVIEHTCDFVDFSGVRGQRCLIVGGRQSAFEWAALMSEAGAAAVHVSHRHDTPTFTESDWSWVAPLVDRFVLTPGWYHRLGTAEKEELNRRLWVEGRLKIEPWLEPRVRRPTVCLWPNTHIADCRELSDGSLAVTLERPGEARVLEIDRIVLATGYRPGIRRVPFLASGNLLSEIRTEGDAPVLDSSLQSSVPGLFMTSLLATRSFGSFFAFTVAVRASAKLIGRALRPT